MLRLVRLLALLLPVLVVAGCSFFESSSILNETAINSDPIPGFGSFAKVTGYDSVNRKWSAESSYFSEHFDGDGRYYQLTATDAAMRAQLEAAAEQGQYMRIFAKRLADDRYVLRYVSAGKEGVQTDLVFMTIKDGYYHLLIRVKSLERLQAMMNSVPVTNDPADGFFKPEARSWKKVPEKLAIETNYDLELVSQYFAAHLDEFSGSEKTVFKIGD